MEKGDKAVNKVLVSYILGIVGIVFAFVSPVAGLILGIVGYVHGKNEKDAKRARTLNKLAIVLSVIFIIVGIAFASYLSLKNIGNFPLA